MMVSTGLGVAANMGGMQILRISTKKGRLKAPLIEPLFFPVLADQRTTRADCLVIVAFEPHQSDAQNNLA